MESVCVVKGKVHECCIVTLSIMNKVFLFYMVIRIAFPRGTEGGGGLLLAPPITEWLGDTGKGIE